MTLPALPTGLFLLCLTAKRGRLRCIQTLFGLAQLPKQESMNSLRSKVQGLVLLSYPADAAETRCFLRRPRPNVQTWLRKVIKPLEACGKSAVMGTFRHVQTFVTSASRLSCGRCSFRRDVGSRFAFGNQWASFCFPSPWRRWTGTTKWRVWLVRTSSSPGSSTMDLTQRTALCEP